MRPCATRWCWRWQRRGELERTGRYAFRVSTPDGNLLADEVLTAAPGKTLRCDVTVVRRVARVRVLDSDGRTPLGGRHFAAIDLRLTPPGRLAIGIDVWSDRDGWITVDPAPPGGFTLRPRVQGRWRGGWDEWLRAFPELDPGPAPGIANLPIDLGKVLVPTGEREVTTTVRMPR
jgi:hypothetical protein